MHILTGVWTRNLITRLSEQHMATAQSLPSTLLAWGRDTPSKVFIEVYDEQDGVVQRVTYAELSAYMISAASFLRYDCNLRAGDRCAMLAHNSVAYLSTSLGAMALGAVSLNLNWRQPVATTRTLLKGLAPPLLCASDPFIGDAESLSEELSIRLVSLLDPTVPPCTILPAAHPKAVELAASAAALDGGCEAAVFFTGGTTGAPKAVPHSHSALLWLAESLLRFYPDPVCTWLWRTRVHPRSRAHAVSVPSGHLLSPLCFHSPSIAWWQFATDVPNAGTLGFTPYFHVMGFVANTVFNLHTGCRCFILASYKAALSPRLMLGACATLRPSVINTVPWIVEGFVGLMHSGDTFGVKQESAVDVLKSLHLLTYGGGALPSSCPPILKSHGILLCCTYGQTELAGPVMFGSARCAHRPPLCSRPHACRARLGNRLRPEWAVAAGVLSAYTRAFVRLRSSSHCPRAVLSFSRGHHTALLTPLALRRVPCLVDDPYGRARRRSGSAAPIQGGQLPARPRRPAGRRGRRRAGAAGQRLGDKRLPHLPGHSGVSQPLRCCAQHEPSHATRRAEHASRAVLSPDRHPAASPFCR